MWCVPFVSCANMTESFKSSTIVTNDSLSSFDTAILSNSSSNILVALRRIKIEENSLTKDINKMSYYHESEDYKNNGNNYLEFKKYSSDLKGSLIIIRDLYEEIKANATSEDNLQVLDIDDVKKDVLGLENKIETMKAYLQSELFSLKHTEHNLVQDAYDQTSDCSKFYRKMRLPQPKLNEMVPSPVRVLINSPFKCTEVEQFQNFLKTSKNRYGGWNAYHHNIFEQVWRKYFGTGLADDDCDVESWEEKQKTNDKLSLFLEELLRKIPGMPMKDFIEHRIWYTQYIHLKNQQQKALERWREKKKIIKKHRTNLAVSSSSCVPKISIDKMDQDVINSVNEVKEIKKTFLLCDTEKSESSSLEESKKKTSNLSEITKEQQLRYLQHTAQWTNRCNSSSDISGSNFNIEDVQRLGVPVWRLHLGEN